MTAIADADDRADALNVVASAELPTLELVGTLLSSRAEVALVVDGSNQPRRLRVGDIVSDWRVVHIKRDDILLKQDDEVEPIRIR